MICNTCIGDAIEREAVILQKMRLSLFEVGGIKRDFCYVAVCEEHKSKSTDDDMFIPLPGLIDLPLCAAYKRITELELRLEIEQLKTQKCTCPKCLSRRTGKPPPTSDECTQWERKEKLQKRLANLPAGEFQCCCPECIDMRENHGQTRVQLREEVALLDQRLSESRESLGASETTREEFAIELSNQRKEVTRLGDQLELSDRSIDSYTETCKTWEEHVDELDKEIDSLKANHATELGKVLKFIREYFSTVRFPGLEYNASFDLLALSDEQLLELIQLGRTAYHSKQALNSFLDSI